MMIKFLTIAILVVFIATSPVNKAAAQNAPTLSLKPVIEGLPPSWALAVSPNNQLFITHRAGGFSYVNAQGQADKINFVPDDLLYAGQGGLLDLAFHPDYANNGWLYLSYSAGTQDDNALKVVRFKLDEKAIVQLETIYKVHNSKDTPVHYGGRLAFTDDGALLISTGDGFDYREMAQVKSNHLGKIIRVTDSGKPHPQNPFYTNDNDNASFVFSLGHRNPQGLLVTEQQVIIAHEHGPAGGDEINFIEAGKNYGWPVITQGKDYIGATISPFTEYPGMQQPAFDWTPSIAPSGMVFYTNEKYASLQQHILVTSLKYQRVHAVPYNAGKLGQEKIILDKTGARLRDIVADLNGDIWVLSDGENSALFKVVEN
jgi:glucose/arabinose dehydrogenase